MKKFFLIFVFCFFSISIFSQEVEKDTTKKVILIGKKEIIITSGENGEENIVIREKKDKLSAEDKEKLDMLKKELVKFNDEIKKTSKELKKDLEEFKSSDGYQKMIKNIENMDVELEKFSKIVKSKDFELNGINHSSCSKKFKGHFAGFSFGFTTYLDKDKSQNLSKDVNYMDLNTSESWNISLNMFDYGIPVYKDNFGFVTGLGIEWHNYHFDEKITLSKDEENNIIGNIDDDKNFDKNKLVIGYLNVPLTLEVQFPRSKPRKKRIYISGGVYGRVKILSYTQQEYKKDGESYEDKVRSDFNLRALQYGFTARIGYRFIKLFANYNANTLFESNKGPELYPFTIGITLLDW